MRFLTPHARRALPASGLVGGGSVYPTSTAQHWLCPLTWLTFSGTNGVETMFRNADLRSNRRNAQDKRRDSRQIHSAMCKAALWADQPAKNGTEFLRCCDPCCPPTCSRRTRSRRTIGPYRCQRYSPPVVFDTTPAGVLLSHTPLVSHAPVTDDRTRLAVWTWRRPATAICTFG